MAEYAADEGADREQVNEFEQDFHRISLRIFKMPREAVI
jgi:hypothetical protein